MAKFTAIGQWGSRDPASSYDAAAGLHGVRRLTAALFWLPKDGVPRLDDDNGLELSRE